MKCPALFFFFCVLIKTRTVHSQYGAWEDVSVNDKTVKDIAHFVVLHINLGQSLPWVLLKIEKAQEQVVDGKNYKLKILIDNNYCNQNNHLDEPEPFVPNQCQQECVVEVWDRPWLNSRQVLSNNCLLVNGEQ